jgi:HEPN domain-containing protein
MSGLPEKDNRVRAWIKKAEDDFRSAEHLLAIDEPPFEVVCFHAQQCAEKYIKAFLLWCDIDFPRTHDLVVLARLIPEDRSLKVRVTEIVPLNRCSTEPRYPGDWGDFTDEDAEEALTIARSVRNEIRNRLPDDGLKI